MPVDKQLSDDRPRLRRFQLSLLKWYERHQRDLPWRKKPTLYRVWLSEIMLQQTQVDTVVPYFNRFVKRFPSIKSLAEAPLDDVLKLWEGLGYYRRARFLHATAQRIREEHRGRFPTTFSEVIGLPGVGRYTAGAILSIANSQRVPILEGNTIRLFTRLMDLRADVKLGSTQETLWQFAEDILPETDCGSFNQALMEVGNQLCKPARPACKSCPLRSYCAASQAGTAELLPANSAKQHTVQLFESLFVVRYRGKMLLRKCAKGERWQGLFDFPRLMKLSAKPTPGTLAAFVERELGIDTNTCRQKLFWTTVHHVTKYKINLNAIRLELPAQSKPPSSFLARSRYRWFTQAKVESLPLNKTAREAFCRLKSETK